MTDKQDSDKQHNLKEQARAAGLALSTVRGRLKRHGDMDRALREPPMSRRDSGKIGASRSPWRFPG